MADVTRQFFSQTATVMRTARLMTDRTFFGLTSPSTALYRAMDSGTVAFVTWPASIGLTPTTNQTSPNYSGTLSDKHLVRL